MSICYERAVPDRSERKYPNYASIFDRDPDKQVGIPKIT